MFSFPPDPSVYQRVLGERFAALHPSMQAYFGAIPAGRVGVGEGIFDVAGSRVPLLRPLLAASAARHFLFPDFGRDIPFTITNAPDDDGTLSAVRVFHFRGNDRVMEDTMSVVDGRLIDRLGKARRLEVALDMRVHDGGVRMESGRCRLRLAGVRLPLPRLATVTVDERVDAAHPGHQRVDVRIRALGLGEVFRYSGSFAYRIDDLADA